MTCVFPGYVMQIRGTAMQLHKIKLRLPQGVDIKDEKLTDEVEDRLLTLKASASLSVWGVSMELINRGDSIPAYSAKRLIEANIN